MSTRRSAPLDGSLLARKGSAAPAIPDDAALAGDAGAPLEAPAGEREEEAPAPRTAPMTGSRRGLVVLVSAALIAIVSVAIDRLIAPADRLAAAPAPPPVFDAPVVEAPVTAAMPEAPVQELAAAETAILDADLPAPQPVVLQPEETPPVAAPAEASPDIATIVPDAPPPPPLPARKLAALDEAATPPPLADGPYILQLAAFSNAGSAQGEASRLQKRLGPVLGDRKVIVVKAGSDPKPVYRLRASGYPTLAAARDACDRIRKLETGCLVIRR